MEDRGLGVVLAGEDVLGIVEARAGEPFGARHLAAAQDGDGVAVCLDVEKLPDRRPEPLEVLDGPAPERVVAVELEAALGSPATQ